jgi:hypothetical protein
MASTLSTTRVAGDPAHPSDHDRTHSAFALVTKTANYTMAALDGIILANGTFAITLPDVTLADVVIGKRFTVKNIGTGTVTISPAAGTIDGAATFTLLTQYSSVDFVTDGTNWFTV